MTLEIKYFSECKTTEQIKKKYLKLAKEFHPDVNKEKEATKIFQEILKQRDKRIREIMRAEGKNDYDIDELINTFGTKDFDKNIMSAAQSIAEKLKDEGKLDLSKPDGGVSFGKLFGMVLKEVNKAMDGPEKKKLDK